LHAAPRNHVLVRPDGHSGSGEPSAVLRTGVKPLLFTPIIAAGGSAPCHG